MSPQMILILIVLGILVVITIGSYNSLVALKNQLDRAWANIDVILKQRFDEIPQLIEIVEQYVRYEKDVLSKLIEARTHYMNSRSSHDKMKASSEMSAALGGVLALGEAYPELKSNQNFVQLQGRISSLEESLADRREVYNESVAIFNSRIAQIPTVIFANILGFQAAEMFKVAETEKVRPSLKMNLGS